MVVIVRGCTVPSLFRSDSDSGTKGTAAGKNTLLWTYLGQKGHKIILVSLNFEIFDSKSKR